MREGSPEGKESRGPAFPSHTWAATPEDLLCSEPLEFSLQGFHRPLPPFLPLNTEP